MSANLNDWEICHLISMKDLVELSFFQIQTLNRFFFVLVFPEMVNVIGEHQRMRKQFLPIFSFSGSLSEFKQIPNTVYAHRNNTVIPSYKNEPFITGSGTNHNVKTEIFDLRRMEWLAGADYPFTKMNIQKKYFLGAKIVFKHFQDLWLCSNLDR